ncbi:hypothetical protein J7643_11430 [bacterium]|nr:hypothetical protein [bacterium]
MFKRALSVAIILGCVLAASGCYATYRHHPVVYEPEPPQVVRKVTVVKIKEKKKPRGHAYGRERRWGDD